MTFRVGQKVVCVDATGFERYIDKGAIYEITSIRWPYLSVTCRPADLCDTAESARGYYHTRFRPVVERKTDISIFERMLTGGKIDA